MHEASQYHVCADEATLSSASVLDLRYQELQTRAWAATTLATHALTLQPLVPRVKAMQQEIQASL